MAEVINAMSTEAYQGVGKVIDQLCKAFAIVGGVIFTALAAMSLWSIVGRWLFSAPVLGDVEIVELASAVAVSLVLPYTQWVRGHVIVDFVTLKAPPVLNARLDGLANVLLTLAAAALTSQTFKGMVDLKANFDSSMLLGIPTWWSYAGMVPAFALLTATSAYCAVSDLRKRFK